MRGEICFSWSRSGEHSKQLQWCNEPVNKLHVRLWCIYLSICYRIRYRKTVMVVLNSKVRKLVQTHRWMKVRPHSGRCLFGSVFEKINGGSGARFLLVTNIGIKYSSSESDVSIASAGVIFSWSKFISTSGVFSSSVVGLPASIRYCRE